MMRLLGFLTALLAQAGPALAVAGLQNVTPIADRVSGLYDLIFWITFTIFVGVWAALAYVLIRFRHRPDREAQQFHGHAVLELIWTVLPVLALIAIAIPTYQTLRYMQNTPPSDLTVQVIGHQWYWEYQYPDEQITLSNADLVIPSNRIVKVLVQSVDVVHSWAVPEFGFKLDAVPGHINEGWVYAKHPGVFDGYCMQLCGTLHAKMLTRVRVLEPAAFQAWLQQQHPGKKANVIP